MKENCQLCKHLDCDGNGRFRCGLSNEILQYENEGAGCGSFEEYIEEQTNDNE